MKRFVLFVVLSLVAVAAFAQNLTCYDVQYTEEASGTSPYFGQTVVVEGIVTAVEWAGHASFWISDPEGGPWSGVLVFDQNEDYGYERVLGELVEVHGLVDEYYEMTEIKELTNVVSISTGNALPDPYVITTGELASQEAYEGILARVNNVTVTQAEDEYYQWYVDDYTRAECQIDDGFFYLDSVDPPIVVTVGNVWGHIIGIVDYSYDEYGLNPRSPEDMHFGVGVDDETVVASVAVKGNYPNPFNPTTTVAFDLAHPGPVQLHVYNVRGQLVTTLVNDTLPAGNHTVSWQGRNSNGQSAASGLYFLRLQADGQTHMRKALLLK